MTEVNTYGAFDSIFVRIRSDLVLQQLQTLTLSKFMNKPGRINGFLNNWVLIKPQNLAKLQKHSS